MAIFPDEWASAWQYAHAFRALGLQVVPCHASEKRPLLQTWREFQHGLTPQRVFDSWYDPTAGEFRNNRQMGLMTGSCSLAGRSADETSGLFVIDLDTKDGRDGVAAWRTFIQVYLNGIEPETWRARSGGGGLHIFFLAPKDWIAPTTKFPVLGLDVRGQGGFLVVEPSAHPSGGFYEFEAGFRPGEVELAMAPVELCTWIDALREEYGHQPGASRERVEPSSSGGFRQDDGRETKLLAMVWAAVVDLRRESPIPPAEEIQAAEIERLWTQYELTTKSRLPPRFGVSNGELLELEGRGRSELVKKWRYAMAQWETKVAEAAKAPKSESEAPPRSGPDFGSASGAGGEAGSGRGGGDDPGPQLASAFSGLPPDREWIVPGWIAHGEVNSLYGGGATGKSLLALQLCYAAAVGAPWIGLQTRRCSSLFVSCEDDTDELHRRHVCILRGLGYVMSSAFANVALWDRVGQQNLLAAPDGRGGLVATPFLELLAKEVAARRPDLLVLDTLADMFGGDEVNRAQVNAFLKSYLGGLIRAQKANGHRLTVLVLAHPSVAGQASGTGLSGSTSWENGVRARMYLSRNKDGASDIRTLERSKANYAGGDDGALTLVWRDGVFERLGVGNTLEVLQAMGVILREVQHALEIGDPYMDRADHPKYLQRALPEALLRAANPFAASVISEALDRAIKDRIIRRGRAGEPRGWRPMEGQR